MTRMSAEESAADEGNALATRTAPGKQRGLNEQIRHTALYWATTERSKRRAILPKRSAALINCTVICEPPPTLPAFAAFSKRSMAEVCSELILGDSAIDDAAEIAAHSGRRNNELKSKRFAREMRFEGRSDRKCVLRRGIGRSVKSKINNKILHHCNFHWPQQLTTTSSRAC